MVDFEEPGVINPDGLGAVVSGMAGVYSLQWVTEEEAAVVGMYRLDIRLLFTDGLKIIFSIQSEMLKRPIQLRLLTVHTSCNLVKKVARFTLQRFSYILILHQFREVLVADRGTWGREVHFCTKTCERQRFVISLDLSMKH